MDGNWCCAALFWAMSDPGELMEPFAIFRIGQEALWLTVLLSAPAVVAALIVGLLVGVFQAATQLQEQTLSFAPKLLAVICVIGLCGAWMLSQLTTYTAGVLELIASVR